MQKQLRFFYVILVMLPLLATGQTNHAAGSVPNSLRPAAVESSPVRSKAKPVRFKKAKVQHTAQYEFYVRIEKAAKEKQRILKELSKPQYSDFRYFGHKKIPRRRPAWKMRYCNECGIRH